MNKTKILLVYTGGTIGMIEDHQSGQLKPFNFNHLHKQVPELKRLGIDIKTVAFDKPIDSSDMNPQDWRTIVEIIKKNYILFDGFVILHGSDTMAYTASALSFMLENLSKPVILTGSQLPIGKIRTDGKENLITAIEIAAAKDKRGNPLVPEVCIYFEYRLLRGNRTTKISANHFNAFASGNYPVLAQAGVEIDYNMSVIQKIKKAKLKVYTQMDNNVSVLKIFPGIKAETVDSISNTPGLKGLIIETFGSGNATTDKHFLAAIHNTVKKGIFVCNVSQCISGFVEQGKYQTSQKLKNLGVIGAGDMTTEAALTKLMWLLANQKDHEQIPLLFTKNLRGELTENHFF